MWIPSKSKGVCQRRNGPAEKPVLCNACGSRYRIRGRSLENYARKHAQGKSIAQRARFSSKALQKKRKFKVEENFSSNACKHSTTSDDSTTSKSCSESAISCPQSCYEIKEDIRGEISGKLLSVLAYWVTLLSICFKTFIN